MTAILRDSNKTFPIMMVQEYNLSVHEGGTFNRVRRAGAFFVPVCVPWPLIFAHEKQARKNHSQTVERLAERGGLTATEAVAVLEDRPYQKMGIVEANLVLCRIILTLVENTPT